MKELCGELTWEDAFGEGYETEEDSTREGTEVTDLDSFQSSISVSEDDLELQTSDDLINDAVPNDELEAQDLFSARRATRLLLDRYPDAFAYDPKSMRLEQFLKPEEGLTEFGWLYLQMLAYSVSGKHYRFEDQSNLNTLAVSDCASWLETKVRHFSGKISNLRAVLYTRMRNTMSNSLYKENKYIATEDATLDRRFSPTSITLECGELEPFVLDYSFKDVKEARLLTLKLWGFHKGTRLETERNWTKYRFDSSETAPAETITELLKYES